MLPVISFFFNEDLRQYLMMPYQKRNSRNRPIILADNDQTFAYTRTQFIQLFLTIRYCKEDALKIWSHLLPTLVIGSILSLFISLPGSRSFSENENETSRLWTASHIKEPVRRALLVGINKYQVGITDASSTITKEGQNRASWSNLDGPANDVDGLREILIARFGFLPENIRILKNSEATRENIVRNIQQHLTQNATAGDISLFFYAGHGSQVRNSKSTELDQLDESLVPVDSAKGAPDIRDKELAQLFNQILDKQIFLTVISDSCHSGSIQRGGYPRAEKLRRLEPNLHDIQDPLEPLNPAQRGALIFSASRDDQPAAERTDEAGIPHGLFSAALLKTLQIIPVNEPAEKIYLRVKALMQTEGSPQEPILATNTPQRPLFGNETTTGQGLTTVAVSKIKNDTEIELQGGRAVGLAEGCELKSSNASLKNPIRLQVLETIGLNRCLAKVMQGSTRSLKIGDLFDVDKWVAPDEAMLRVWMPSATLKYADLLRMAKSISTLQNSEKIVWLDDPSDSPAKDSPLYVVAWNGTEWQLILTQGKKSLRLGINPTAQSILDKLTLNEKIKPTILLNLPPTRELKAELHLGEGSLNNSIKIVAKPAEANYFLMGRWQQDHVEYSWVLPNIASEQAANLPLPMRSDWRPCGAGPDEIGATARILEDKILRLGKIKAWLQLEAPPERSPFPYRLALRNIETQKINTSGKTIKDENYELLLQTDPDQLNKGLIKPRYIYVFVIDSFGKTTLLFPQNGEENIFPTNTPKIEYILPQSAGFSVSAPFGVDTFVLLASNDVIPNASEALNSEGARTRSGKASTPLEKLLIGVGSATRSGLTTVPPDWSIQRISVRSIAKSDQSSFFARRFPNSGW